MYKQFVLILLLSFFCICSNGQVTVSLQEPPAGIVQNNQLWNMTLIYSGTAPLVVTIGLSLFDNRDNQPVMTANSQQITLTNGIKQVRMTEVGPIEYNYIAPSFNINRLPESFLPIGSYRACYAIYGGAKEAEGILSEDCINIEVQPLSPPQLSMPSDSAEVETPYPQFSWLPPAPIVLFSNLNYDLLVTEIFPGQTAETAIQENLPVYLAQHLPLMFNNYPASNKGLDTGKVYAWRVVAKNDEMFVAQSEVWTFSISNNKNQQLVPANGNYLTLRKEDAFVGTGIISENILGLKYYSYDRTHDAAIRFLNDKGEVIRTVNKTIKYGDNFMVFELESRFSEETTYSVEVMDLQMTRYKTSFRISK